MNVAAELQWNLMPPRAFANHDVVISAAMEPAYEVGGDAFDYAIAGDQVHVAIFDAMGNNSHAGLTANLAVAACRNHRRQGTDLVTTGERVEQVLVNHLGHKSYATAILADLNAAHRAAQLDQPRSPSAGPDPRRTLDRRPALPAGAPARHRTGTDRHPLPRTTRTRRPGPVLHRRHHEARDALGREFGPNQFTDFIIRHHADGLPVPETLRRLMRAVLDHHGGRWTGRRCG